MLVQNLVESKGGKRKIQKGKEGKVSNFTRGKGLKATAKINDVMQNVATFELEIRTN